MKCILLRVFHIKYMLGRTQNMYANNDTVKTHTIADEV